MYHSGISIVKGCPIKRVSRGSIDFSLSLKEKKCDNAKIAIYLYLNICTWHENLLFSLIFELVIVVKEISTITKVLLRGV